jgi:hypothetical protein
MSANCDEQVVRIRQRAVFSAIVGSDRRRGFRLSLRATRPLWTSALGRHLGKLSDGSYGVGTSCTTDKVVELGK